MNRRERNLAIAQQLHQLGEAVERLDRQGLAVAGVDGVLEAAPVIRLAPTEGARRLDWESSRVTGGCEGIVRHYLASFGGVQVAVSVRGPALLIREAVG